MILSLIYLLLSIFFYFYGNHNEIKDYIKFQMCTIIKVITNCVLYRQYRQNRYKRTPSISVARHYSECERMIKWCIRRSNRAIHSKPEIKLDIHHFVYFCENIV